LPDKLLAAVAEAPLHYGDVDAALAQFEKSGR
jgi:hypothetical protein